MAASIPGSGLYTGAVRSPRPIVEDDAVVEFAGVVAAAVAGVVVAFVVVASAIAVVVAVVVVVVFVEAVVPWKLKWCWCQPHTTSSWNECRALV